MQPFWSGLTVLWLQGTTTNGEYLLPFRTGAFLAGVPVQPVILKYGKVPTNPCCCRQLLAQHTALLDQAVCEIDCVLPGQSVASMGEHQRASAPVPAAGKCKPWPDSIRGAHSSSSNFEGKSIFLRKDNINQHCARPVWLLLMRMFAFGTCPVARGVGSQSQTWYHWTDFTCRLCSFPCMYQQ